MKKALFMILILLSGCVSKTQSLDSSSAKTTNGKYVHSSIYNRYKFRTNRYTQLNDGAPTKGTVNLKEPIPVREPLSRYGNPTEYSVEGRSYQVMRSSKGYKSRGIASWYGTKFHKQRTSSGEPYNMYVMTAAHKTLPLPTYAKVTNLSNGKVAIVKINDRGPFRGDRIIDLSYAAALKLGVFPKGTAPVEIETLIGPETRAQGRAHYYLQVASFLGETSAKQLKAKLARFTSSPVHVEHNKRYYIVRVGPFDSKNIADGLKRKLVLNGIKGSYPVLI